MTQYLKLLGKIVRELQAGRKVAMSAVVKTSGSAPQSAGAMLVRTEAGELIGTIGGGRVEADVLQRAAALIEQGGSELLVFHLDQTPESEEHVLCGGKMWIAIAVLSPQSDLPRYEPLLALLQTGQSARIPLRIRQDSQLQEYGILAEVEPHLLIAGAGHVGTALALLGVELEFSVTVIDDRSAFANEERLPPPIKPVAADIEQSLKAASLDRNTFVVIVTRGHAHDERALRAVVDSDARYIGMIGSSRKVERIFGNLRNQGVSGEALGRVHAPIGIDINSVTVAEIAVSIAAQLIKVRRGERTRKVEGPLQVDENS